MIYTVGNKVEGIEDVGIEHCVSYFKNKINSGELKSIALDTETSGLKFLTNKILSIQLGDSQRQYVLSANNPGILAAIELLLKDVIVLGHNLKFDGLFLRKYGVSLNKIWDTLLAEGVLTCGLEVERGLAAIAKKYLDIELSKDVRNTFSDQTTSLTFEQVVYAARDVEHLHSIANAQIQAAIKQDLLDCILFENQAMLPIMDIEFNGMGIDHNAWLENTKGVAAKAKILEHELDKELLKVAPEMQLEGSQLTIFPVDYKDTPRLSKVNWASPKQVLAILNNQYAIFPVDKKGKPSTEEMPLYRHRKHPFVKLLIEHRGLAKEVSSYGLKFIQKNLDIDGRVHTSFWQILDTGRLSSAGPNMQQIPADPDNPDKNYRKFFTAKPGYKLITCDFSSQEPRITAHYCQDPVLLEFFKQPKADMHSFVATKMFSVIYGKPTIIDKSKPKERAIGKQTGLKLDYGGTAFTLQNILETTQEEAQRFIDAYWAAFPTKRTYFDRKIRETMNQGFILIDPILRRKSYLSKFDRYQELRKRRDLEKPERREVMILKGDIERRAMNYPKQIWGIAA